jgi:hypothetical protein
MMSIHDPVRVFEGTLGFECFWPTDARSLTLHHVVAAPFRPTRIIVPPECSVPGAIQTVLIGSHDQLAQRGSIPLSVLCPSTWVTEEIMQKALNGIAWDTATIAMRISIMVALDPIAPLVQVAREALGIHDKPHPPRFRLMMIGWTLR